MLAIILGSRKILVLEGSRVGVQKILKTGFTFQYESLKVALKKLYS